MFEIRPKRDDERVDLLNRMFQPVNELLGQDASAIDSQLATFKADVKKIDNERVDILNSMLQSVNELLGQCASAIDSRLATFKADVKKIDNKYIVEAELPGYKKDEISINYDDSYLTISAKKETEDEIEE